MSQSPSHRPNGKFVDQLILGRTLGAGVGLCVFGNVGFGDGLVVDRSEDGKVEGSVVGRMVLVGLLAGWSLVWKVGFCDGLEEWLAVGELDGTLLFVIVGKNDGFEEGKLVGPLLATTLGLWDGSDTRLGSGTQ